MISNKLTYLVVENAPDVCEGIIRRMAPFSDWHSCGYCLGLQEAAEKVRTELPGLLFLDWGLNGGSAFELLRMVQNIPGYDPYIIFNTGFQKDNPEIPQEIINRYKVDKYLVKPFWENLRNHLPAYLAEAAEKLRKQQPAKSYVWLQDHAGANVQINLAQLVCICQHPAEARCRILYFAAPLKEVIIPLQWQKCYELLRSAGIDFFITKSRSHLVIKDAIEKFEKPFVRLKHFPAKIEVVKENLRAFEKWLLPGMA